jgi:Bacterial PH domain
MAKPHGTRAYRAAKGASLTLVGIIGLSSIGALIKLGRERTPMPTIIAIGLGLAAFIGVMVAWSRRSATIITEDYIALRGLWRTVRIAWPDVQAIRVESNVASVVRSDQPKAHVFVYDRHGTRRMLPCFTAEILATRGQDIKHELAFIEEIWLRRRGADWVPLPDAQGKIGKQLARERRYLAPVIAWLTWTAAAVPLGIVVFVVLLLSGFLPRGRVWVSLLPLLLMFVGPALVGLAVVVVGTVHQRRRSRQPSAS